MIGKSFNDISQDQPGTVYANWEEDGLRCLVMRGPVSLCAYIGVKSGHPLYGVDYPNIDGVDCHGGLTFSRAGGGEGMPWPDGYWWIGWDYAHYGDRVFYDTRSFDNMDWNPDDVVSDMRDTIEQVKAIRK